MKQCLHTVVTFVVFLIDTSIDCPPGMVYQQCGPLCPQTCNNIGTSICHGGCAEGCFCPDGLVLSEGRCIEPLTCPGKSMSLNNLLICHTSNAMECCCSLVHFTSGT